MQPCLRAPLKARNGALREPHALLLRDDGEDREHRILEQPVAVEVLLREALVTYAGRRQPLQVVERFERALAGEEV